MYLDPDRQAKIYHEQLARYRTELRRLARMRMPCYRRMLWQTKIEQRMQVIEDKLVEMANMEILNTLF